MEDKITIQSDNKNMKRFSLEEYLKNPSRKVVTREGNPVKILCTNFVNTYYPVVAEVLYEDGKATSYKFTEDGIREWHRENAEDLFFMPEKHDGWINIFKGASNDNRFLGHTHIFKTKEQAEEVGKDVSGYIITIKIEWEE